VEEHLYFRKGAHAIWIRVNFATSVSYRAYQVDQAAHQKWRSTVARLGALAATRMPTASQADHRGPPPTSPPGGVNTNPCPPNCSPTNSRESGSGYRFDSRGNMIGTDGTGQTDPGYCKKHAKGALDLLNCWQTQHGEGPVNRNNMGRLPEGGSLSGSGPDLKERRQHDWQNCMDNPQTQPPGGCGPRP
jgi:hypothetical protein